MAPPAAKNDTAAAIQKQILTLVQAKGKADAALHLLVQSGVVEDEPVPSSRVDTATTMLRMVVNKRLSARGNKASIKKRDNKKPNKDVEKQWALVAAKVAQSIIKLYLGAPAATGSTASTKNDIGSDLSSALDLATLALSITCQFEGLIKLGDLVLENMLYQIAKKFAETSQGLPSALLIFGALHLRMWHHHAVLCTQLNQPKTKVTSPFEKRADQLLHSSGKQTTPLGLEELGLLCTFPSPQSFHTLQYTRFFIGLVNVAINVLLPAGNHKVILDIAVMLEPWINHLSRIPGVDAKLPGSFSDRLFRVLWKCGAAVDAEESKTASSSGNQDAALEYRSVALSYMLKCPSYSNAYFIQQVHRVGVQHEKRKTRTCATATAQLSEFYMRSATTLYEVRDMKHPTIEWDYIHWLEHFMAVCESHTRPAWDVDTLTVVHHAIGHASAVSPSNPLIVGCLQAIAGCIIVERHLVSASSRKMSEKDIRKVIEGDKFHSVIKSSDRDTIVASLGSSARKGADLQWVEAASAFLSGLVVARGFVEASSATPWNDTLSNFVLRSVRKVSTRLFNAMVGSKMCPSPVADLIVTSLDRVGDLLTSLRRAEPEIIPPTHKDSFLAAEGRVRRLGATIGSNQSQTCAEDESTKWLGAMSLSIVQFQQVLDAAMTATSSQRQSMPSLLGDLQAIAREAYTCATHYYKKKQHSMVVQSLESAFALAENYLEHVLCDEQMTKKPEQVAAAHSSLKVDAIASLLAYSLYQIGDISRSRQCHGHAILYASDPVAIFKSGAIGKYVDAVVEEFESCAVDGTEDDAAVVLKSLCESLSLAWAARAVGGDRVTSVVRLICGGLDRVATRNLDQLRLKSDSSDCGHAQDASTACKTIQSCGTIEQELWRYWWERDDHPNKKMIAAVVDVISALSKRRCAFGQYYHQRQIAEAIDCLHEAHVEITRAIDQLSQLECGGIIDMGGSHGWRGVIALEICQLTRYAAAKNEAIPDRINITESSALHDIKQCLSRWEAVTFDSRHQHQGHYFDVRGAAVCLDAISHALSLLSHAKLESQARNLLSRAKATQIEGTADVEYATSLPSLILQPEHIVYSDARELYDSQECEEKPTEEPGMLRLRVIDAEIGLCLTSATSGDPALARVHLSEATAMMKDFRLVVKISSENPLLFSAFAMRELALAMASSEIHFQEGELVQAIREAKSALSICWKISRKVGVSETKSNGYDELPDAVKNALGKHVEQSQKTSQLIYFQAIECWSWDVLLAAKLILSRIASLYALTNQPYRSSIYYAEAMTLVGGVVPVATRNRPFFEFAQLQVLAERTSHAAAVHELISVVPDVPVDELTSDGDISILTQNCEVQLQRGDLFLLEGEPRQAKIKYELALQLLEELTRRTPAANSVACGCYRRMVKIQLQPSQVSENAVDELLGLLKQLKRATKKCPDVLEYALGTCQLVQASLFLLRSSSSKAFLPAEKLAELMEDTFTRCDHLGIPFLTQEIRVTAGLVYLMLSESSGHQNTARAAACLLSSYNIMRSSPLAQLTGERVAVSNTTQCIADSMTKRVQASLPPSWLIVSLTVGVASQLSISLTPTDGSEPVSFWIGNTAWKAYTQELSALIEASRVTLFGNTAQAAEEWTPDKKKIWWNTRKDLDDQLASVVVKMQTTLGFWRTLFTYRPIFRSAESNVIDAVSTLLFKGSRTLTFRSKWLLSAVAASNAFLSEKELLQCIDHIAIEENVCIPSDMAQQVVQVLRKKAESITTDAESSVILLLHHQLEQFPWEGLDVLRSQAVTRMPSIELILQNAERLNEKSNDQTTTTSSSCNATIDQRRVSYLLNPGGDLKTTQTNLEPIFHRGEADLAWQGTSGAIPEEDTIRRYLVESDLFVYCGHGSGEKYFHRDKIEALRNESCAAALLFGCSSGRLEREGVFGPNGAVLSYLQAGSPAVLAMLWDVTDKDVDLVSKDILENWLLASTDAGDSKRGDALSIALQRSRRLCKLSNLNGLAAVCYGLPLHVAKPMMPLIQSPEPKRRRLR